MNFEIKNELYYSDLICELKSLAGLEQPKDKKTKTRIQKRKEDILVKYQNDTFVLTGFKLSVFQEELFQIVSNISIKANIIFYELEEISRYPELVQEEIYILENKINMLTQNKESTLTKKLIPSNK